MDGALLRRTRMTVVGALGATILLGSPAVAQADQGKWWTPKEGGRGARSHGAHGYASDRAWGHRGHGGSWRGARIHRDVIVIRDGHRGAYFRARRVFIHPRFHRRAVFVRPVRYFISADACIGGIGIHARFHPHYLYGCNFCDARFDTYGGYAAHVAHCDAAPDGYRVSAYDWSDGYDADGYGRGDGYDADGSWRGQYDDEGWDD